ncbi:MAG: nucleotidyltransferase [Verrucomicrobia bacterium]|nr:nucleotidyltransferase [Verrucomicrobiota bacterium]
MSLAELKEVLLGPCRRHPVRSLRVFGSVARGQASPGSDLDLLVQFEDLSPAEYATHYFGLLHELQDAVGTQVDLLTPGGVTRPSLKRNIREESVLVYEA